MPRLSLPGLLLAVLATATQAQVPPRTILAIGAHAGDVELSMGQVLVHQKRAGDRIVILHMTAGEGGNPKLSPAAYGEQKRREAAQAASIIGAEIIWAPYQDGQIPDDDAVRLYVADVIRTVKPAFILTHWRNSIHKDHARTSRIVDDAVLLASLEGVKTAHAPHRGVRGLYYAENWEDPQGFAPYLYIDASDARDTWLQAIKCYEFVSGNISSFPYLSYYDALAVVRGAEARKARAVAFNIDDLGKKRILEGLP
ncbi:MAG TPA: PIG-L family deacetylase [Longimicrobiales bacterium]